MRDPVVGGNGNEFVSENVHLRHRRPDPDRPSRIQPPTSAVTFFQVEKTKITNGGKVGWSDAVRFRHLPTQMYLSLVAGTDLASSSLELVAAGDTDHTLFEFVPIIRDTDFVPKDAYVRVRHVFSGCVTSRCVADALSRLLAGPG